MNSIEFHEDRTRNVASRVFTNQMWTTDKRIYGQTDDGQRPITKAHLSNQFHLDCTKNVTSRLLTRKNILPPAIIKTNVLTKFHKDSTINMTSTVLRKMPPAPELTRKTAPAP
ncbi:hypothetical protein DPMN_000465 [Dreissena polymorpha]|uniref:Uncharacterized protein n=1 Tax=Dreissena polymorpha TaxID=45954 RepID=A0A9D4MGQ8_DREPO|nr:hypothetical protein DPMN_000465 [Dreissena polymorpha]